VPLSIVSGYAIATLWGIARDGIEKLAIAGVFLVVVSFTAVQMVSLNFFRYDDDQYPYVYAHTERTFLDMIKEIDRVAKIAGTDEQTNIAVMAPEYWPLPWYLQRYTHVGYFGRVSNSGEPIVIAADSQEAEFTAAFSGKYKKVGSYKLRPGVTLSVFVRKDVPT
jgi:predicted membrane-bound mannosyltransferase